MLDTSRTWDATELARYLGGDPNEAWENKEFVADGQKYRISKNLGGGTRQISAMGGTSGGASSTSSSGVSSAFSTDDLNKAIESSVQKYKEAIQPAIKTIESSIDPLKKRYTELLTSIKGQGTTAVNQQTAVTSAELGKRGILGSSTLAGQEIQKATEPVRQQWAGLEANTGIAQEKDLSAIAQAIAQLQSGAATSGITTGSNVYTGAVNASNTQAQNAIANEIARKQLENATKKTEYDIKAPYFKPDTGTSVIEDLIALLGGKTSTQGNWYNQKDQTWADTTKYPVGTFVGKDGKTYTRYSDGSSGSTIWTYK